MTDLRTYAVSSFLAAAVGLLVACGGGNSLSSGGSGGTPPPPPPSNPVPAVLSLTPSSANAGGAAFTLTITGRNFVSSSGVQWNGGLAQVWFSVNSSTGHWLPQPSRGWAPLRPASGDFSYPHPRSLRLVHYDRSGSAISVMPIAAPLPLFRFQHQAAFHRIAMHVPQLLDALPVREYRWV